MAELSSPEKPPTLREQSGEVVADLRQAAAHGAHHIGALAELLQLELGEYMRGQTRRMVALMVGGVLLACAYLLLCLLAVEALRAYTSVPDVRYALLIVVGGNVLLGLVALWIGRLCKPAAVAPATLQEIKNDVQCIQLYLKNREKS